LTNRDICRSNSCFNAVFRSLGTATSNIWRRLVEWAGRTRTSIPLYQKINAAVKLSRVLWPSIIKNTSRKVGKGCAKLNKESLKAEQEIEGMVLIASSKESGKFEEALWRLGNAEPARGRLKKESNEYRNESKQ
jgi:hypothetical protein